MATVPAAWLAFAALVVALLALDLGVLHRRGHVLAVREAALWSAGLVLVALAFGAFVGAALGATRALEYYTAYLVELALSVDNLFVFIFLFRYFAVPEAAQPTVLKWGIFGAMLMRGVMIGAGTLLLRQFAWVTWLFGALIVVTGVRMFRAGDDDPELTPDRNPLLRLARRVLPMTDGYHGARFRVGTEAGMRYTPLLLVLLVVEWTDVLFAVDSIPAVFAVSREPVVIFSSNVLAVLGLRALFFLLAGMLDRFHHLKAAVAGILVFIGAKMLLGPWVEVSTGWSLLVVGGALVGGVLVSLALPKAGPA